MSSDPAGTRDIPGVIVLPPLLFLSGLAGGLLLHWLVAPVRLLPALPARLAGAALVVLAVAVVLWAEKVMNRAGTNIRPDRPTHAIVTGGPFRFSRNPIYIATTVMYVGISLLANALWPLVFLLPVLLVLNEGVVKREERYLERKFGEEYAAYRRRVRRWF